MSANDRNKQREPLVLQYRTAQNRYTFNLSVKKKSVTYDHAEALELIQSYPAEERNCRIVGNRIMMKAGNGQLPLLPEKDAKKTVKLYTQPQYLKSISPSIISNDEAFLKTKYVNGFLERHRDTIYAIDRAVIVNYSRLKIETPYGIASVDDLSTGCKTMLNILYLMETGVKEEALVNVDEAGNNVLKRILDLVAGSRISLYITHDTNCINNDRKFILNGKEMQDEMEFSDAIWEDDSEYEPESDQ